MNKEFDVLLANGNWELVVLSVGNKFITFKWVLRVKLKANVTLKRYKAYLITKGYLQIEGLDYGKTFSLVFKHTTIHVVLNLALSRGWFIRQIDVNNVFLYSNLTEDVYMKQSPDFQIIPDMVCKLKKGIVWP